MDHLCHREVNMAVPRRFAPHAHILQQLDDDLLDVIVIMVAHDLIQHQRRRRRFWVKPWLERRAMLGQYNTLLQELDRESEGDYMGYIRMDRTLFGEILQRVAPRITRGQR